MNSNKIALWVATNSKLTFKLLTQFTPMDTLFLCSCPNKSPSKINNQSLLTFLLCNIIRRFKTLLNQLNLNLKLLLLFLINLLLLKIFLFSSKRLLQKKRRIKLNKLLMPFQLNSAISISFKMNQREVFLVKSFTIKFLNLILTRIEKSWNISLMFKTKTKLELKSLNSNNKSPKLLVCLSILTSSKLLISSTSLKTKRNLLKDAVKLSILLLVKRNEIFDNFQLKLFSKS